MSALLAVEVRRMLARQLIRLVAALAVLGILITAIVVFFKSHASADVAGELARQNAERRPMVEACERGDIGPPLAEFPAGEMRAGACEFEIVSPARDPRFHLAKLSEGLQATTVPLVIAAWLLGASLIGAEWRAGTTTTMLTWEPRRVRVMLVKVLAAVLVGAGLAVLLQALLVGSMLPAAIFRGTTEGAGAAWVRGVVGVVLRGAALAGVAGAIGFSIGSIGRNTAAALGGGFVYLAILEGGLLGGTFPWLRRWLIVGNSIVLVTGRPDAEIVGRSPAGAGIVLALYAAAVVLIATAVFRRRDVT